MSIRREAQPGLLWLGLVLFLGGAACVLGGAWNSRRLTGEWLGYPLPTGTAMAWGIGILACGVGVFLLIAYAMVVAADKSGLTDRLHREVLPDEHPAARAGIAVLRVHHAWKVLWAIVALAVVAVAAFTDPLVAGILAGTIVVVAIVYLAATRRSKEGK